MAADLIPSPELIDLGSKLTVGGLLLAWVVFAERRCNQANRRADEERAKNELLGREYLTATLKFEATLATIGTIITTGKKT